MADSSNERLDILELTVAELRAKTVTEGLGVRNATTLAAAVDILQRENSGLAARVMALESELARLRPTIQKVAQQLLTLEFGSGPTEH